MHAVASFDHDAPLCLRVAQPVCRRQAAQIDKERQQHKRLTNLFTTAFTVNLVLFVIAAYCLVNLVESFSKMEDQTVYNPYEVGGVPRPPPPPLCARWGVATRTRHVITAVGLARARAAACLHACQLPFCEGYCC